MKTIAVTCRTSTERLSVILVLITDPAIHYFSAKCRPSAQWTKKNKVKYFALDLYCYLSEHGANND
jgi:hypothetical protein